MALHCRLPAPASIARTRPIAGIGLVLGVSLCAFGTTPAQAHDTWLEERAHASGRLELALTSGTLFPGGETGTPAEAIVDRGCVAAGGARVPLQTGAETPAALTLVATASAGVQLRECWVQTTSFDVELKPALIPVYLREISASEAVRVASAEYQRRGLPWVERYTKHARISFLGAGAAASRSSSERAGAPPAMALDLEIDGLSELRAGKTLRFRVLRDGQPLAAQAVELRGDMSPLGLWRRTDAEGRASVLVPFAGRWVLRATDLRPVRGRPGHWESRFITHTFTVPSG